MAHPGRSAAVRAFRHTRVLSSASEPHIPSRLHSYTPIPTVQSRRNRTFLRPPVPDMLRNMQHHSAVAFEATISVRGTGAGKPVLLNSLMGSQSPLDLADRSSYPPGIQGQTNSFYCKAISCPCKSAEQCRIASP